MKKIAVVAVAVMGLVAAQSGFAGNQNVKGIAKYFEENSEMGGTAQIHEGEMGYHIGCGVAQKILNNPDLCTDGSRPLHNLPQPPVTAPGVKTNR